MQSVQNRTAARLAAGMAWMLLACLLLAAPAHAAVRIEVTNATKDAFERTKAQAARAQQSQLDKQMSELNVLGKQAEYWEDKTRATKKRSDEAQAVIRKQLKAIDAAKVEQLEKQVKDAKTKYEPLFTSYTALNKQISASRAAGTKQLTSLLRSQAEAMQPAVQLARGIVRAKEQSLKAAKEERTKKMDKVRAILDDIAPLKVRIQAERSAMKAPAARIGTEWKNFKLAVKKADPNRTSSSLTYLVADFKLVVAKSSAIDELETRIAGVVARAQEQLKASGG
jgi:hypothetical protein